MALTMMLAALTAQAQAAPAPPKALDQVCTDAIAVEPSRELDGIQTARVGGEELPVAQLACIGGWINSARRPVAVVVSGKSATMEWEMVGDVDTLYPSGMLLEGDAAAIAAARREAERLGLPVRPWRDTARPSALLVGGRDPLTELAEKARSGALGAIEVGHFSVWEPDPDARAEPVAPMPFDMIFTGPTAGLDALEAELRRDGWIVRSRATSGGTSFIEASSVLEEPAMPDILLRMGMGAYPDVRSAYVTRDDAVGFVGNEAR